MSILNADQWLERIFVRSPDVMIGRNLAFALRCLTLLVCLTALKILGLWTGKVTFHQTAGFSQSGMRYLSR